MTFRRWIKFSAMLLILASTQARAQQHDMPMPANNSHDSASGDMKAGMARMTRDMENAPMTGNMDQDFVAMMIPHHQGAIDMARAELRDGKDPALRRLAAEIVAAQQKEIAMMRRWQASHPKR